MRLVCIGDPAAPVETVDRETGHALKLALVDAETGTVVPRERIRLRAGPGADDSIHRLLSHRREAARARSAANDLSTKQDGQHVE